MSPNDVRLVVGICTGLLFICLGLIALTYVYERRRDKRDAEFVRKHIKTRLP